MSEKITAYELMKTLDREYNQKAEALEEVSGRILVFMKNNPELWECTYSDRLESFLKVFRELMEEE